MLQAVTNKHSLVRRRLCDLGLHCMVLANCFLSLCSSHVQQSSIASYYTRIAICAYTPTHLTPPLGGSRRNIAAPFSTEKLKWRGYPRVKKFRRYVYSFWHDPRTWQTEERTNSAPKLRPFVYFRIYSMQSTEETLQCCTCPARPHGCDRHCGSRNFAGAVACYLRWQSFAWFQSYLDGRTQHVRCGGTYSTLTDIICGVPQGSVLGPILFIIYTADLASIVAQHGLSLH